MGLMTEKLYAQRNPEELEPFYSDHVLAMTQEDLRSKAAIAAELAYRDSLIKELRMRLRMARAEAADYFSTLDYYGLIEHD